MVCLVDIILTCYMGTQNGTKLDIEFHVGASRSSPFPPLHYHYVLLILAVLCVISQVVCGLLEKNQICIIMTLSSTVRAVFSTSYL
jgi:hypothetical protein